MSNKGDSTPYFSTRTDTIASYDSNTYTLINTYKPYICNKYLWYGMEYGLRYIDVKYSAQANNKNIYFVSIIFAKALLENGMQLKILDVNLSEGYQGVMFHNRSWDIKPSFNMQTLYMKLNDIKDSEEFFIEENKVPIQQYELVFSNPDGIQIESMLLINGKSDFNGHDIVINVSGIIPTWVFKNMLPLEEKAWINNNGELVSGDSRTYHISMINETWYQNVHNVLYLLDSDIDFLTITENYVKNFYVKKVGVPYTMKGIELPFQYWEDGELKPSEIEYIITDNLIERVYEEDEYVVIEMKPIDFSVEFQIFHENKSYMVSAYLLTVGQFGETFKNIVYGKDLNLRIVFSKICIHGTTVNELKFNMFPSDVIRFNGYDYVIEPDWIGVQYLNNLEMFRLKSDTVIIKELYFWKEGITPIGDRQFEIEKFDFNSTNCIIEFLQLTNVINNTKIKEGMNPELNIIVSGAIPRWVYDDFLPLETNGFINEEGIMISSTSDDTKYHITYINKMPFEK